MFDYNVDECLLHHVDMNKLIYKEMEHEVKHEQYDRQYNRFVLMHERVEEDSCYTNVKISHDWHNFDKFYSDIIEIPNYDKEWEMDKDLLSPKGQKIYSKETVCFLPIKLNKILCKNDSINKRGLPRGVSRTESRKFCSRIAVDGKLVVKTFETDIEAFLHYREQHSLYINKLVDMYESQLPSNVVYALRDFKVGFDS